jgi:hypothetical protein
MTKKPINYQKTSIFKIVSLNPALSDWHYIDYTTDFAKRKCYYKRCAIEGKNEPLFNFINENGGWNNFQMLMLQEFPTTNKELVKTHIFQLNNPAISI